MCRLRIDLSELTEAFDNTASELGYFLDLETGQVIMITSETRSELEAIYDEIYSAGDKQYMAFAEALQQRGLPDWQQAMIVEADQVERGFRVRYIRVPEADSHTDYRNMEEFIITVRETRLQGRLEGAIQGPGSFRRFRDVLARHPQERERWFAFKDQRLRQRALEWLAEQGIEIDEGYE
jgi:hypothetical protein